MGLPLGVPQRSLRLRPALPLARLFAQHTCAALGWRGPAPSRAPCQRPFHLGCTVLGFKAPQELVEDEEYVCPDCIPAYADVL